MNSRRHAFLRAALRLAAGGAMSAALAPPAVLADTARVIDNPGGGRNRIEVSGNSARNVEVDCAGRPARTPGAGGAPAAAVNSVQVDPRALQGRTVIVTGRNTQDLRVPGDCARGQPPAAQVNSIQIR